MNMGTWVDCNGNCTDPDLCPIPGCFDTQAANYNVKQILLMILVCMTWITSTI